MNKNKETHPSYGMLQFCRTSGGSTNLFGSSITHKDTIRMYLREGSVERTLNSDFFMGGGLIAEVEMSQSQFAEAITSMNMGSGVPVTIKWLKEKGTIEKCPFTDKREQFESELSSSLKKTNEQSNALLEELTAMFSEKKNLTQKDKSEILSKLTKLKQDINENREYIYKQFNEQMDKTTMEAKGEIEAFMQNKLTSIANATLVEQRESLLKLENPVDIQLESTDKT